MDVRFFRCEFCGTDHFLVKAIFRLRIWKTPRGSNTKTIPLDINKLRNPEVKEVYRKEIAKKLNIVEPQITDTDVNRIEEHWRKIKTKIMETAKEVLGERSKRERNLWFDEECMECIKK